MNKEYDRLVVLWTSGDREVALKMVFMYTLNSKVKGWWQDIRLIVWGPSAQLLSVDVEIQEYVHRMREAGITLEACKACADIHGVSDTLEAMGINVRYMGEPLTGYIKEGCKVITF